jgi:hypothetical protein
MIYHKKSCLSLILLLLLFSKALFPQANFPDEGSIYRDDIVPRVDIFIDPDTLDWIYENVESYIEFHADFVFTSDTISDTIPEIGFRLRGNTSRVSQKKSFKISFNTFHPGRQYHGVEKLNLNGEHNDPSVIRSKIAWDLFRDFGIPVPRANHVEVYINGNYYGLYINVEHIDEEFVESRFDNKDGNLYKCLWPADLDYRGSDQENYKHYQGDRRVYDLQTNVLEDDYSDIAQFITHLNQLPEAVFECEMSKDWNIYDYLKVIAVDVFLSNWDGPIYNKNNFYLYHNSQYNRMEYIPYDLDNIFGIDWFGRDWKSRDIYDWMKHGEPRPIYTKLINNESLREIYSQYTAELMSENYTGEAFLAEILRIKDMITPYLEIDPYYPLDYGFSIEDFHNSYYQDLGNHVKEGIFPYIESRKANTIEQLEVFSEQAIINHIRYKVKNDGANIRIRAYVEEEVQSVNILYSMNNGEELVLEMFDDGMHNDVLPNDGIYANTIADIPLDTEVAYQINAIHGNGNINIKPCEAIKYHFQESQGVMLRINEFMAKNDTTISDEYGDYGDWIEIYNADNTPVYLGNKYLTDDFGDRNKWQMPDMYLSAKDFVLFWADDDPDKGSFHTNFKLSAEGEEIGLFDAGNTGYAPLDSVVFGPQQADISQGRYKDGEDEWRYYTIPTPGYSNIFDGLINLENNLVDFYPNPNSHAKLFLSQTSDIKVFNLKGQLLIDQSYTNQIDLQGLAKGLYLVQINEQKKGKLIVQ